MRTSKAEEAILLASEPRDIREYLAKRASNPNFLDPISVEAEAKLLARGNRLLDLSLAEYCLHKETAMALFERSPDDWPVRALVLSNQVLAKASFLGFPECLFGTMDAVIRYLKTISPDERAALFRNPSVDDGFLEAFLTLGDPWEAMDPDQRLGALDDLASNERLHCKRSTTDYDEGWDWYLAGKPFEAAWALIKKLEPNAKTAKHLSRLLRDLPADSYKTEGMEQALATWRSVPELEEGDASKNMKGRLSDFQTVRQAGARLLASRHDAASGSLRSSDDVAVRCGAYEGEIDLGTDAMKAAVERDGDLARVHLARNEDLWRSEETRDVLLNEVLRGADTEEPGREFNRRESYYRKKFPIWFKGQGVDEPDERSITESSIQDLVAGITGDAVFKGIQERLAALEKAQQKLFWLMVIAIVVVVARIWR